MTHPLPPEESFPIVTELNGIGRIMHVATVRQSDGMEFNGYVFNPDQLNLIQGTINQYSVNLINHDNWNATLDMIKNFKALYSATDDFQYVYVNPEDFVSANIYNNMVNALKSLAQTLDYYIGGAIIKHNDQGSVWNFSVTNYLNALNIWTVTTDTEDMNISKFRALEHTYMGLVNVIKLINVGSTVVFIFTDSWDFQSIIYGYGGYVDITTLTIQYY